jgi:hypothetical protein
MHSSESTMAIRLKRNITLFENQLLPADLVIHIIVLTKVLGL